MRAAGQSECERGTWPWPLVDRSYRMATVSENTHINVNVVGVRTRLRGTVPQIKVTATVMAPYACLQSYAYVHTYTGTLYVHMDDTVADPTGHFTGHIHIHMAVSDPFRQEERNRYRRARRAEPEQ